MFVYNDEIGISLYPCDTCRRPRILPGASIKQQRKKDKRLCRYFAGATGIAFFAANEVTMAAIPITMAMIPAIMGRSAAEMKGKTSNRIPKIRLKAPRIPFPASFWVNALYKWTHPVTHAQKPMSIMRNDRRKNVLYSG